MSGSCSHSSLLHTTKKQHTATGSVATAASHLLQQRGSKDSSSSPRSHGRCSRCLQQALCYSPRNPEDTVDTTSGPGPLRWGILGKAAASRRASMWLLGLQSPRRARQDEPRPITRAELLCNRRQAVGHHPGWGPHPLGRDNLVTAAKSPRWQVQSQVTEGGKRCEQAWSDRAGWSLMHLHSSDWDWGPGPPFK